MNSKLEKILMQEASNTNRIYLHYRPQHGHWVAYEQSALNLLSLAPLLLPDEEIFSDAEIRLRYATINFEQMDRYNLPAYCTLLGDDIMVWPPNFLWLTCKTLCFPHREVRQAMIPL